MRPTGVVPQNVTDFISAQNVRQKVGLVLSPRPVPVLHVRVTFDQRLGIKRKTELNP